MRKLSIAIGILCIAVLASTALFGATAKQAPESVKIADCAAKQAAVDFPHAKHIAAKVDCVTCHHTTEGLKAGTDTVVDKCGKCHITPEKAETPKCSEMSPTKNPYHIKCMGCHKAEVAKDATKKLPTKCAECHVKA